jgi:hypothetical protein
LRWTKFNGSYRLKSNPENRPPFDELFFLITDTRLRMRIPRATSPDVTINQSDVTVEHSGTNSFRIMSDTFEHDFLYFVENQKGGIAGLSPQRCPARRGAPRNSRACASGRGRRLGPSAR